MTIDFDALKAPFRPEDLDWRVGQHSRDKTSCTLLCYLTARAVMDRLDQVCGPGGWSDSYAPIMENNKLAGFVCTLAILTPTGWVVKSDVADTTDIEAIKGACSGALKRAAVHWGIGRYLYDLDGKRYYKIKEGYAPDGSNAIYVPIGEKPNTKPGHVFPPELPAWAKPAATSTSQTPDSASSLTPDQSEPDAKPAGKRPPAKKKETPEEKAARQATHHESWNADQPKFCARLAELGFEPGEISEFCVFLKRNRPSQMEQDQRDNLLTWLGTTKGADAFSTFLDHKAKNGE